MGQNVPVGRQAHYILVVILMYVQRSHPSSVRHQGHHCRCLQIDKLTSEAMNHSSMQQLMCDQLNAAGQQLSELEGALEAVQQQLAHSEADRQQQLKELQAQHQQQQTSSASAREQLEQQLAQADEVIQRLQLEVEVLRTQQLSSREGAAAASGHWDDAAAGVGGHDGDDAGSGTATTAAAAAAEWDSERPANGTPAGSRSELAKQVRAAPVRARSHE